MTDNPRTLQFDVAEWRDLCIHAARRLAVDLERFDRPSDIEVADVCHKLDRMKLFLTGWSRSGVVAAPPPWQDLTAQARAEEVAYSVDDGGLVLAQGRLANGGATATRKRKGGGGPVNLEWRAATEGGIPERTEASVPLGHGGPVPRKRGRPRKVVQPDVAS
jgi:hypothetical protein